MTWLYDDNLDYKPQFHESLRGFRPDSELAKYAVFATHFNDPSPDQLTDWSPSRINGVRVNGSGILRKRGSTAIGGGLSIERLDAGTTHYSLGTFGTSDRFSLLTGECTIAGRFYYNNIQSNNFARIIDKATDNVATNGWSFYVDTFDDKMRFATGGNTSDAWDSPVLRIGGYNDFVFFREFGQPSLWYLNGTWLSVPSDGRGIPFASAPAHVFNTAALNRPLNTEEFEYLYVFDKRLPDYWGPFFHYIPYTENQFDESLLFEEDITPPTDKIFFGGTAIQNINFGSTPITEVYHGPTKVWP